MEQDSEMQGKKRNAGKDVNFNDELNQKKIRDIKTKIKRRKMKKGKTIEIIGKSKLESIMMQKENLKVKSLNFITK